MAESTNDPLLALVHERGMIDDLQRDEVAAEAARNGKPVLQVLNDMGIVDTFTSLQVIADHLGTEVVEINEGNLTPEVLKAIPSDIAKMHLCLPIAVYDTMVQVALADPLNPAIIDEIGFTIGKEV